MRGAGACPGAARPVLGNLIAGLQIGLAQPIRLDDVVIVEGEWGVIEEITGAYVVIRIWDERRLVVPLQVTEARERAMQLRALVSAADAGRLWDLRCRVREALVAFVQHEFPEYLPRVRADSRMEPS